MPQRSLTNFMTAVCGDGGNLSLYTMILFKIGTAAAPSKRKTASVPVPPGSNQALPRRSLLA